MASPTFVDVTNASYAAASVSATHSARTAGHYMLAWIVCDADVDPTINSTPSGWSLLQGPVNSQEGPPPDSRAWLYGKFAAGGETSTGSWGFSVSNNGAISVLTYSGTDATTAVHASVSGNDAAATSHTFPSVTTTVNECRIIGLIGADLSGTLTPFWSAWTNTAVERVDYESTAGSEFVEVGVADYEKTTAGSAGLAVTSAGSTTTAMALVALQPSGAPPWEPQQDAPEKIRVVRSNLSWR